MNTILANVSVGIAELKINPSALIEQSEGAANAVLNRNKPVASPVPAERYEALMERLEDYELAEMAKAALAEGGTPVEVRLDGV